MHPGSSLRNLSRHPGTRPPGTRPRLAGGLVALVLSIGLLGCSGGGDDRAAPTTSTTRPGTNVDITLGQVTADSAGPPVSVGSDQSQRVIDAITTYVKGATVDPLRSGQPSTADFSGVFAPITLATATTTDRAVVLDEGLPRVTGNLTARSEPVALVGLGDQAGNLTLIDAVVTLDVQGATATKGAPLHVVRRADLVLQPDPTGTWKITAYDISVTRDGGGLTPPATTGATATSGATR